jgi:3-dehydro-4-phosphotetronate decarboxylase
MADERLPELEKIAAACRRMYDGGLVTGALGSVGVRTSTGEILVNREGCRLGFLRGPDMLVMNGNRPKPGKNPLCSDAGLMKAVLEAVSETGSVIRVYSPYATALAHRGKRVLEEAAPMFDNLRGVGYVPYFRPGTTGLAAAVAESMRHNSVVIIENQSPVVRGADIDDAIDRAEALEAAAKVVFILETTGDGD